MEVTFNPEAIFIPMSIDKDINQPKFRNEKQKAIINIIYTSYWINEKVKTILDKEDITQQQFNILRILRGAGKPLSTLQIRQRMLDKMSDTSRIVDRLVAKKLVKKIVCASDKRMVDVSISAKGISLLEKIDQSADEMDAIAASLTKADAKTLTMLLDKMRESI